MIKTMLINTYISMDHLKCQSPMLWRGAHLNCNMANKQVAYILRIGITSLAWTFTSTFTTGEVIFFTKSNEI